MSEKAGTTRVIDLTDKGKGKEEWVTAVVHCEGVERLMLHNPVTRSMVSFKDLDEEGKAKACLYTIPKPDGEANEVFAEVPKSGLEEKEFLVGFPKRMMEASLIQGGTRVQVTLSGRKNKITVGGRTKSRGSSRSTLLFGFLRIKENFILINDGKPDWGPDTRPATNPTTGGVNPATRALIQLPWNYKVTVTFDKKILTEDGLAQLFREAGRWFGLGTAREIGFGKFVPTKMELSDQSVKN